MRIHPYLRCAGRLGLLPLICLALRAAGAGSATWNANPTNNDWNTAANWTPNTVPNGPSDVATFGASSVTAVSFSADLIEVDRIIFSPGASSYTITSGDYDADLLISGAGVINNSGVMQIFGNENTSVAFNFAGPGATVGNLVTFHGGFYFSTGASAGHGIFIPSGLVSVFLDFYNDGTNAGKGTFHIKDAGDLIFDDYSSAADSVFTVEGFLEFDQDSSAGNATITVNPAACIFCGVVQFDRRSTAANSTLIANGGTNGEDGGKIQFLNDATGGTAKVKLFGNGNLDLSAPHPIVVTIGSLEGDGIVFLGERELSIGSNSLSTLFSGTIQDGGEFGGSGGRVRKIGTGTLTLTGANTYTGNTTVTEGTLVVANGAGSATGTGAVQVDSGTLSGSGIIAGAVTVGTGSGTGSFLAPAAGTTIQTRLTIQSAVTLNSDASYTYTFKANTKHARTDLVVANGVTINGATLAINATTQGQMKLGLVLNVISNTSANPVSGTFSNLPDGAIVTVNGNNLQASYEGGDGNDFTLTVVP